MDVAHDLHEPQPAAGVSCGALRASSLGSSKDRAALRKPDLLVGSNPPGVLASRVRAGSPPRRRPNKKGPALCAGPKKWTRTQRIRTAATLSLEVALVDTEEPPVYQRIATKARHLRELGLSDRVIAQRLGVSDKTVGKAIRWLRGRSP